MPQNCQNCGKEIFKKPTESNNRFLAKKYCSPACSRAFMKKNKIGWFSPSAQSIKKDNENFVFPDELSEGGNESEIHSS